MDDYTVQCNGWVFDPAALASLPPRFKWKCQDDPECDCGVIVKRGPNEPPDRSQHHLSCRFHLTPVEGVK